ncbi:MAG: beta-ureidopropionase [Ignavibacteria bacterium]|nr:beta-ureidopropionase [Ignavibacteria bacterium]
MKIGYLQFKPELLNAKANTEKVSDMISGGTCDLLVIPELANSGYLFKSVDELVNVAENPDDGKFCGMLKKISGETKCHIIAGFCEKAQDNGNTVYYNSSILVFPDGKYRIYRKTHLFYDERKFFIPGNTGFWVYDIYSEKYGNVKVGMMICFDWIYPEAARTLALRGAQIICHPSNLVMPYCQNSMYTRAIENQVFTITANRIGLDVNGSDRVGFTGGSVILNPKGEYLSRASVDKEELNVVEIDPSAAKNKFINEKNNLFDERRELFYFRNSS